MSEPTLYEAECAQVDVLIDNKKNEIKELEGLKASWSEEYWDDSQSSTPASVASDPNASEADRAVAANVTANQVPDQVNQDQSPPSPSTDSEMKAAHEERYLKLNADLNAEAQADDKDADKEQHSVAPDAGTGVIVDSGTADEDQAKVEASPKVQSKASTTKADDTKGK